MRPPPITPDQFAALYLANRAAADQPSAEVAYWRTEADIMRETGQRYYASYNSFKAAISARAAKTNGKTPAPDKKAHLTHVLLIVNTYLHTLDLPFLQKYQTDTAAAARDMEVFGPLNNTYDPEKLCQYKNTAAALDALINYIKSTK